ncbi:Na+/H+ antiporter subunit E [Desulforapulum autotrophicum]|uniref:Na+/H+ antiporter subunit E n=1 Tax=Desulforapulum autotrophicum TaxID=2296 RepID=UPI000300AD1C|nr:Na+/H+ antiporter subunit E [Desulforapulum autotrophicum]
MFLFWVVFSGRFDGFHLGLGVISCAIVSWFVSDLSTPDPRPISMFRLWLNFILYFPWLIWQIFLANIHVLLLVLSPNMMDRIDPHIVKIKTRMRDRLALVTFANSITLTPGTITVNVSIYGDLSVHAIDKESAAGLPGEMERRVAGIFGE